MSLWSRRRFFLTSLAGTAAAGTTNLFAAAKPSEVFAVDVASPQGAAAKGTRPIMISSANGGHALQKGMDILKSGGDTLDAAGGAATGGGADPKEEFVGFGGLPKGRREGELGGRRVRRPT